MELKKYNHYIFKWKLMSYNSPFKGVIIDITDTTILVENLDSGSEVRYLKEDFLDNWTPVELIKDWNEEFKAVIKELASQPIRFIKKRR